jgi:RNA polymerase sigma-70 factor (ECF subfamily)
VARRYTPDSERWLAYARRPVEETHAERDTTDSELARRLAGGDSEVEAELYRRLAPRVRLYGLRHLRDPAAADDLVQDALLMALEALRSGKVRQPGRFVSFLLGSCRRIVADLRRGAARRERLLERFGRGLVPAAARDAPPAGLDRLAGCLEGLPERDRSVVVMSFYAEAGADRIGAELGLSPGNVRVVRHRALARLRSCVEGAP